MSTPAASSETPRLKVILLLVIGLVNFGAAPILIRYAMDVQPVVLAALRTLMAVLFLLPFWMVKHTPLSELKAAGVRPSMMALAGFSLGIHFFFWIVALHYTSVASASVLVTMHPVLFIITERLLFKNRFPRSVWIGVFISCTGSVILGIMDHASESGMFENPLLGNLMAFTAAVIFVVYFMIGSRLRQKAEWIDYVFYVYLYAAITCTVLALIWIGGVPVLSSSAILVGVLLAVGPTIAGHGAMNYVIKYVSPTILSTLILSEVIIAAIAAYFLFGELPSPGSIGAMMIILAGVTVSWLKQ